MNRSLALEPSRSARRSTSPRYLPAALALTTSLCLGALCALGGSAAAAPSTAKQEAPAAAATARQAAAKQAKPSLMVYTYDSFSPDLMKSVEADMAKAYGVDVKFRTFEDTGMMYSALLQEKGKRGADVVIGLDSLYVARARKDGLFQAYKSPGLAKVGADYLVDPGNQLLPFDYGVVTFCYDSEKLKSPPTTWYALTSDAYRGQIVIENPLTSSPGQALLFASVAKFGESGYLDFWKKLKPNLLTMSPGWSAAYGLFTSGEAPIVLSYGTSPVYHLIYDKTERYKAFLLDGSAWQQVEVMGVAAGTKQLKAAKSLIDYCLGTKFQTDLQETEFMYPVRSDVELAASFRVAVRPTTVLNRVLPDARVAAGRDKWLSAFDAAMTQSK